MAGMTKEEILAGEEKLRLIENDKEALERLRASTLAAREYNDARDAAGGRSSISQMKEDVYNETAAKVENTDFSDVEIPDDIRINIEKANIEAQKKLINQQELAIAKSDLQHEQDAEKLNLDAIQTKEITRNQWAQGHRQLWGDMLFSGGKDLSKEFNKAYQLDSNYYDAMNNTIPTALSHSLEQNDLAAKHRREQIDLATEIARKQANDEFNSISDNYKAYIEKYREGTSITWPQYAATHFSVMAREYGIESQKSSDRDVTVGGIFPAFANGTAHLLDSIYNLEMSLGRSLLNLEWTTVKADPFSKAAEAAFGFSFERPEDLLHPYEYSPLDKFGLGYAFSTLVESLPEMGMLFFGMGPFRFSSIIGKGAFNKALGQVDHFVLNRANTALRKRASALRAVGNTEAAATMEALAAKMSSKQFLGTSIGKYRAGINEGIAELGVQGLRRAELTRTEFSRLMGKLAAKNKFTRAMAKRMDKFGQGAFASTIGNFGATFPFAFFTFDLARRTMQLANERGDGSKVRWADAIGAFIHLGVDWAGVLAGSHALNKMASNAAKKGIKSAALSGVGDMLSTVGIEGFGEVWQTYMEQQAKSNWTLPPLFELLNSPQYKKEADQIILAGLLGGAAGGMMSIATTTLSTALDSGRNITNAALKKIKDKTEENQKSYNEKLAGDHTPMMDPEDLAREDVSIATEAAKKAAIKGIKKATGASTDPASMGKTPEEEDAERRQKNLDKIIETKNRLFGAQDSSGKRNGKGKLAEHNISEKDVHNTTEKEQTTSYKSLREKVNNEIAQAKKAKRDAETIPDATKRAAEVAAREKEISDLQAIDKDLEFLQTQQTAKHFSRAANTAANRAMNRNATAKAEFADPKKKAEVQAALNKIDDAENEADLNKAVKDLVGLIGDKSMWNYYQKLLKSKHIRPSKESVKMGDPSTKGEKSGDEVVRNKPIDDTTDTTEELGAEPSSAPDEEMSGEEMDLNTIRTELAKLDTSTLLAIMALHDAQSTAEIGNINYALTGQNIDPRVRQYFKSNTAVVLESEDLSGTSYHTKSNIRQKMAMKANKGAIDVSPFEIVIVENQHIKYNTEKKRWEIHNLDTKGASIDMMNNAIADAISGIRVSKREAIMGKMKEITNALKEPPSPENTRKINDLLDQMKDIHKKQLESIINNVSTLNYLIMILPKNSPVRLKFQQLLKNTEIELKAQQKDITDILKKIKTQLGRDNITDDISLIDSSFNDFRDVKTMNIYTSLQKSSSRLFGSIRQIIEEYASNKNDEKKEKNFRDFLINIIKQIGKVLSRINDYMNSDEFVDLYSTAYSLLEYRNVDYMLADQMGKDKFSAMHINRDGIAESVTVKFNPMLKWLPISMQELLSNILGRMRFYDVPEVLLNRILNKDNLLKNGKLDTEAISAMSPFLNIMRDVEVTFRVKTSTSTSIKSASINPMVRENLITISLADIIDCGNYDIFDAVLSDEEMMVGGSKVTKETFANDINNRRALQARMIEKYLSGKDSDTQIRLKNAIMQDQEFLTHMENMLDIGIILQVYQLQNSTADQFGIFENKLQSKNVAWARKMLINEDGSKISDSAFHEFANAAIALANNYMATKDYIYIENGETKYRPLMSINPYVNTIVKADGKTETTTTPYEGIPSPEEIGEGATLKSEFHAGLLISSEFLAEVTSREWKQKFKSWVDLMTNRILMSNNIGDIVIQLVQSSMPISQKMVFVNSLQQTGIEINDNVLSSLDLLLYPTTKDVGAGNKARVVKMFLAALKDPRNIIDAETFNNMKTEYHKLDNANDKLHILEGNDGRNFYGNWKRIGINKSNKFKYMDEEENIVESDESFQDDFVYVFIPAMAFKYDSAKKDIVAIDSRNQDILSNWLAEIIPNYDKMGSKAFLDSLIMATQTSVEAITNKETITNSTLDRMESVSASFGTVVSMAAAYYIQTRPTEQHESNQMLLVGNIDYSKIIYFAHQQQPDGRVSAMSSKLSGNKLAKIFHVKQPEYFYGEEQLRSMRGYGDRSQFYDKKTGEFKKPWSSEYIYDPETGDYKTDPKTKEKIKRKIYRNPEFYKYGLYKDEKGNIKRVKDPKSLAEFKKDNKYEAVRYGQLAAFLRIFGLDIEKYKLEKQADGTYKGKYQKEFKVDLSLFEAKYRDALRKRIIESNVDGLIDISSEGDVYTIKLSDIGALYRHMLNGNRAISTKIYNMTVAYSRSNDYNGLTLFSDHLADSMYNLTEFFGKFDKANGVYNLHLIDNRKLRLYFDGTSTLYFQNAIRFLAQKWGITLTGISETTGKSHDLGVKRGLEKIQLEELITGWLNSSHNFNEEAKNKIMEILKNKGIDGHTLPLILMTIANTTESGLSLSTHLFINSQLGNRDTIKGVMTPLGYNAAIDNILQIAQDSIIQTVQPAITNAIHSFIENSKASSLDVMMSNGHVYKATNIKTFLKNLMDAHFDNKDTAYLASFAPKFFEHFLEYIQSDEFINSYVDESMTDKNKEKVKGYYKSIFSSFAEYFSENKETQLDFLGSLVKEMSFKNFKDAVEPQRYSISIQNASKGIMDFMNSENEKLKKYNAYFGTTKSVDLNNKNIIVPLNKYSLSIANELIDYLEEKEKEEEKRGARYIQRLMIMHNVIKKEWINSISAASGALTITINGTQYIIRLNKDGKKFKVYNISGSEINQHAFLDSIRKQYDNNPDNKKHNRTIASLGSDEIVAEEIITILTHLAIFKNATSSNLQDHVPLGYDTNPLLQLPRQAAELLEKSVPHIYQRLSIDIIRGVDAVYKALQSKFAADTGISEENVIYNSEFKREFIYQKDRYIQQYLERYFQKTAYAESGEGNYTGTYTNIFTQNPDEQINAEHYRTIKLLTSVFSQATTDAFLTDANLDIHSKITILQDYGKRNQITMPGTNALFNQPFEAFVVSHILGMTRQTFDSVETSAVNFYNALNIWNSENRLFDQLNDTAYIAERFLKNIRTTSKEINSQFKIKSSSTEKTYGLTIEGNDTIDFTLNNLNNSDKISPEHRGVYRALLMDEVKTMLNLLKHYFSLSRTENAGWSGNVLFADYDGILRGGHESKNITTGKPTKTGIEGARRSLLVNLQTLMNKIDKIDKTILDDIQNEREVDIFKRPTANVFQLLKNNDFLSKELTNDAINEISAYLSKELQKETIDRAEAIDQATKDFFGRGITRIDRNRTPLLDAVRTFANYIARKLFGRTADPNYRLISMANNNIQNIIKIGKGKILDDEDLIDISEDDMTRTKVKTLVQSMAKTFFHFNKTLFTENENDAIKKIVDTVMGKIDGNKYSINSLYREIKLQITNAAIEAHVQSIDNNIYGENVYFKSEDFVEEKIFKNNESTYLHNPNNTGRPIEINFTSFRMPEIITNNAISLIEILKLKSNKDKIQNQINDLRHQYEILHNAGIEHIVFVQATNDINKISPLNTFAGEIYGEEYYIAMARYNSSNNILNDTIHSLIGNPPQGPIPNSKNTTLGNRPGRRNSIDLSNSENQIGRYRNDILSDIDEMTSNNKDLSEEFGILKDFVNNVWKYLREGIEVFYSNYVLEDVGRFTTNEMGDRIIIGSNRAVYTRLHEFVHAVTYHAINTGSNRAHMLLARLEDLRSQIKDQIDSMDDSQRAALGISDDIYNYLFASEGKDSINSLAEFIATFFSEPQLIRYLKNTQFKTRFPSLKQHKGKWNKALHAIPSVLQYITQVISRTITGSNGINAFAMLTQTLHELSQQNNEAGREEFREYVNGKPINRLNSEIKNYAKSVFRRKFTEEEWAEQEGIQDVNAEITRLFDEYLDSDETFNQLLEWGKNIRSIETKPVRLAMMGVWLLSTFAVKISHILDENPLQRTAINEAIADLRARVLQGTFFDSLIKLDFGIAPNIFLGQQANLINRAASLRNNLDYESNQAENMVKQQVTQWIDGNPKFKEMLDNDPESRAKYETALFKTITHLNIGDFFFFDNDISMSDVNRLTNYILNAENEEVIAECRSDAANYVMQAFQELGINDAQHYEYQNAIKTLVIDLAKARISDQLNEFNTSNIEMGMKQLGFTEYNSKAMSALHKAITLEAIAYPFREQNLTDSHSVYYKEETKLLRQLHNTIEAQGSEENIEIGNHIKTTLDRLIRLHAFKHKQMYRVRALKQGELHRFLRSTNIEEEPNLNHLYTANTRDLYDITDNFEHNSYDAYYLDSRKPYKFNHQRDVKELSLDNPPLPKEIERQVQAGLKILTEAEKRMYYNMAKKKYIALGYKQLNLNRVEGEQPKYMTDDGTEIWIRESWIDLKTHKTERLYKSDPGGHKGRVNYLLNDTEFSIEKEEYDVDYAEIMKQKLLEKGSRYSDDYVGATQQDYENTSRRLRTKAGSSTMLETSRLSTQEYETIVNPSKSVVDAFGEMERTIHNNMERHILNDQIFYQILQSDTEVRNRRMSLDDDTMPHNSEVLFYIDNGKLTFNRSLTDKYNIYLSARDEDDFANLYNNLPNEEKHLLDDALYIDSRLINIYFGRPNLDIGRKYEDSHPLIFKAMKTFQTAWQSLLAGAKNTIIMRNPELVYINGSGNFWGLIGEGIPFAQAVESWSYYVDKLKAYNNDFSTQLELQNTLNVFERVAYTQNEEVIIPRPEGKENIKFSTNEEYRKVVDELKKELEIVKKRIEKNPVMPLVKAGFYSNLIEDADRENTDIIEHAVEWAIKNAKFDQKKSYIARESFLQESSDTYKIAGHLTRMGDFIPRVILYYHLRDEGASHQTALDEARDRFINYNTPIWSNNLAELEQAGLVMFTKYRFAVQYQIMKAFAHAPIQASMLMGANIMLEAAGIKRHPFVSYLEEFGDSIPNGVWNMGLDVVSNVNRWKFIGELSDDIDQAIGIAS